MDKNTTLRLKKIDTVKNKPFKNLQQFYEFEFSLITKTNTDKQGQYDPCALESAWSKKGYDIYLLYTHKLPVGFAVVNLSSMSSNDTSVKDIAEFFVMPLYRKKHYGKWMAFEIFKKYPGKWEVRELAQATTARSFWVNTIDEFTKGKYKENKIFDSHWQEHVFIQQFTCLPKNMEDKTI